MLKAKAAIEGESLKARAGGDHLLGEESEWGARGESALSQHSYENKIFKLRFKFLIGNEVLTLSALSESQEQLVKFRQVCFAPAKRAKRNKKLGDRVEKSMSDHTLKKLKGKH